MYESTQDAIWTHSIDLAREADFELGSLRVRPATCEVEYDGQVRALQRRVMQVLVALARSRGTVVSQEDLVQRCWRGLSVSDDAIYRCISKLRKLAADFPDAPFAIEAIPGVGYRLTATGGMEHGSTGKHSRRRRWLRRPGILAAVVLAGVILLGAIWAIGKDSKPRESAPIAVAVQPFQALSDSKDVRALAQGIPNEVVNELGDGQVEAVLDIAQPAGPAKGLIVTGLLREDSTELIVDVRVEDGASRTALWSMEFRRDRGNSADLPKEVAARVADVVNMAIFARTADPPLTDNAALSALLQTTGMIRDAPDAAWAEMLERAQRVVARHPEFAFGHSVLAVAYSKAADNITIPDRSKAMQEAARREANLTLKLDPEDAGAYAVLSWLVPTDDYRAREEILLRGIRIAKRPKEPLGALYSYEGTLLGNVGRLREALSFQLIAQATDEWGPPKTVKLARDYANMGNLPAARIWLRRAIQRWPSNSDVRSIRRTIAGFYEQHADALAIIDAMDSPMAQDDDETAIWQSFIEAKAAGSPRLKSATVRMIGEAADESRISRETEVMMLAQLGETQRAIEAANRALDQRQELPPRFLFTPVARDIRRDPAFVELADRMGLIRYWRETGTRPDFCTGRASRDECSPRLLAALRAG